MSKPVLIETPRLILRKPKLEDAKPLNEAVNRSLNELQRWQPWANDASLKVTTKFIQDGIKEWSSDKQKNFPLIVIHKADNKIIAASGYNEKSDPSVPYYEVGYWLETAYTGQGLATEMTNALTRYAFLKLKAVRVQLQIQSENQKSIKVAKQCGYEHEATIKKVILDNISHKPANYEVYARFDLSGLSELNVRW